MKLAWLRALFERCHYCKARGRLWPAHAGGRPIKVCTGCKKKLGTGRSRAR